MMASIPDTFPATLFPSLNSLFDAPSTSSRPSSYREERAVRCRQLASGVSSARPDALASGFASFLLALTGDDEIVFTMHNTGAEQPRVDGELEDLPAAQHVVYATKHESADSSPDRHAGPLQSCTATIVDQTNQFIATDFALVLGQAPSEALKVQNRDYHHVVLPRLETVGYADAACSHSRRSYTRTPSQ